MLAPCAAFGILTLYMAKNHTVRRKSTLALRQRRLTLLRQLRLPPQAIRGSVVERFGTCGKPTCACRTGAKHGPYYFLTQCIAVGQIRKFMLKTAQSQTLARQAVAAFNAFYDQLEELSQINAELLRRGEPLPGE